MITPLATAVCFSILILGTILSLTYADNRFLLRLSTSDNDYMVIAGIVIIVSNVATFLCWNHTPSQVYLVIINILYLLMCTSILIIGSALSKKVNIFATFVLLVTVLNSISYYGLLKGWF